MTTRQEINHKILDKIIETNCIPHELKIRKYINEYPQQRFGQIICNYICPDYRSENKDEDTQYIMKKYFDINFDPFYEESSETYKRLF